MKEQTSNILKQYNEEYTKEWRDFLQTLNIAELKEDESCGHLIKHYECGIFFSTQFNENLPNIVIIRHLSSIKLRPFAYTCRGGKIRKDRIYFFLWQEKSRRNQNH